MHTKLDCTLANIQRSNTLASPPMIACDPGKQISICMHLQITRIYPATGQKII